jgi:acetyl esterase/lipase
VPFIHRTNAIVVLPNYRLTPEHTGADIMQDLADFWTWFKSGSVDQFLSTKHHNLDLDYSKVLVSGDSAGGYMALMSGLTQPKDSNIKAILAQYPMTEYLRREPTDMVFDMPTPGPEIIEQHMSKIKPGTVLSSATPPARMDLSYALSAYERYVHYFGADKKLWPVNAIEDAKSMPPTWIIHGGADTAVDVKDSQEFVAKWTKHEVAGEVKLSVLPGQEHGFDIAMKEDEEKWLREGLEWVEGRWLK